MIRQYLLLRNNSQTGPFSLQDLLQLNLTPQDLVWVEGHSAGWCYPFEVGELKAFVPVPELLTAAPVPDREDATIQPPHVAVKATPSKKIFVRMPADVKQHKIVELLPSLEEKAEALRQRALNYKSASAVSSTEEPEQDGAWTVNKNLEAGSRTVVKTEKRDGLNSKSLLLFSTALCATAVIVFFIMQSNPQPISIAQTSPAAKADGKRPVKTGNRPSELNTAPTSVPVPSKPIAISETKKAVSAVAGPVVPVPPVVINKETAKGMAPVKKAETPPGTLVKYDLSENRQPKVKARDIPINELVQTTSQYIKSGDGIGLAITIENKSEQPIRTAAVDVLYFDKAKKEAAKQTVYFSNISPHTTVTKNSPYIKAASASYRIGLVSTERWGLYVMQ